jgi:hypothetical protein
MVASLCSGNVESAWMESLFSYTNQQVQGGGRGGLVPKLFLRAGPLMALSMHITASVTHAG